MSQWTCSWSGVQDHDPLNDKFVHQRPSEERRFARSIVVRYAPFMPTCLSYSRSHLLATTMTGNESLSFTRRICWWNVLISSKELREVIEYTSKKPSPVRMYCSRIALNINKMCQESRLMQKRNDWPVFLLTSGIEHVEESNLIIDHALLAVRVWYTRMSTRLVKVRDKKSAYLQL